MRSERAASARAMAWFVQPTGQLVLLAGITLIAAMLRLYKLGEWSFWGDEMFTVSFQEDGFGDSLWRRSLARDLVHAVTAAYGVSEWSARLAPALIGVATVPILYFPTRRLLGARVALVAALLLALSPWHLYWSQNARFYTLLLLFYSLALWTFLLGLEEDRPVYLVVSLVFLALAARERLLALMAIPVAVSYLAMLRVLPWPRPAGFRLRNVLILAVPMGIIGLAFAGRYLLDWRGWLVGFGYLNNNPLWLVGGTLYYIGLTVVGIAALGALYLLRERNRLALFFSLSALLPLLIVAALSLFQYAANRYVFVTLTSWIILASLGAVQLAGRVRLGRPALAGALVAALVVVPLVEDVSYFGAQQGNREDWRSAVAYLNQHRQPGDMVVAADPVLVQHYLGDTPVDLADFDPIEDAPSQQRTWFVLDRYSADKFPQQVGWLVQNAEQAARFAVNFRARDYTVDVYLFEPSSLQSAVHSRTGG